MRLLGNVLLHTNGVTVSAARATFIWRVVAVLVIGALLAKWTWVLFAPNSASVLPAAQPVTDLQAGRLFGIAAASGSMSQAALPNVRLVGVFAGTPGFAVLELDGRRQVGLSTGREIIAGAKLVEVATDHVVIERGGVRQQIQLSGKDSAIKSVVSAPVPAMPAVVAVPDMSAKAETANTAAHAATQGGL